MAKIVPTLAQMFRERVIPIQGGVWIDVYNKICNKRTSGAITTRISAGNLWYVTEIDEGDS